MVGLDCAEEDAKLTNDEGNCLRGLSFGTDGRSTSAMYKHTGLCCASINKCAHPLFSILLIETQVRVYRECFNLAACYEPINQTLSVRD